MLENTKIDMQYSIIIPVYRARQTIVPLLQSVSEQMGKLGEPYEIIMVEDDGGDGSWDILCSQLPLYPQLKIMRLMRNFGQHNALMCGFAHSSGKMVITMDDDLQNPPAEILKLVDTIKQGFDVVYGVPVRKQHHPLRNLGSLLVRFVYKKIFHSRANLTSFRIIRREILRGVLNYNKNFTFIDGLIAWHTTKIAEVEVRHDLREIGKSGYSIRKLFSLAMNMLTNFSILPLQVVSGAGLLFSFVGFFLAVSYLAKYLIWGIPVPGFTTIIIGITLFSGVQMLSLGMIGEYLGRIHLNINTKPQYFVREKYGWGQMDGEKG